MSRSPNTLLTMRGKTDFGFEIMTFDALYAKNATIETKITAYHRVRFYNILWITEGRGVHHIDFKHVDLNSGNLVFISRGQVHAADVSLPFKGFIILFTESFLSRNLIHSDLLSVYRLYNTNASTPLVRPTESLRRQLDGLMTNMHDIYHSDNPYGKEEMLRLQLKMLLLSVEREMQSNAKNLENSEHLRTFIAFREALEDNSLPSRNANDYANELGLSYKHLNTIVKSVTGLTAKGYIDHHITMESKRLLATTNAAVKELTFLFGFDEETNFVKYFKKHTKTTPSRFRKALCYK
jgi:AraC family transcriptional activator of pobA